MGLADQPLLPQRNLNRIPNPWCGISEFLQLTRFLRNQIEVRDQARTYRTGLQMRFLLGIPATVNYIRQNFPKLCAIHTSSLPDNTCSRSSRLFGLFGSARF